MVSLPRVYGGWLAGTTASLLAIAAAALGTPVWLLLVAGSTIGMVDAF